MSQRHLMRAQMLLSQGRAEMAEQEVRQSLVEDPNDASIHAVLAVCLAEQDKHQEATEAASQAIHLGPDESYSHYVMGTVMYHRNRFNEAREAVDAAIHLDPYDPDYFALLAATELAEKNWTAGLQAAERGLEAEPDHVRCINLRAVALTNLGRAEEAQHGIEVALQSEPDNAWSHANQGWTLLHQRKPREAMGHFQEALRIDPNSEYARSGVLEAMKARNFVYRWLLAWFLYLSRLSPKVQVLLVVGILFGQRILLSVAQNVPVLEPLLPVIVFGYLGLVWMTWCGPVLFNLVLRFDRFGRLALSKKERHQSTVVAIYLLVALGWVAAAIALRAAGLALLGIPFAVALIPLNGVFHATNPTFSWIMMAVTVAATGCGFGPLFGYPEGFLRSIQISIYSTWASLFFAGTSSPKKI